HQHQLAHRHAQRQHDALDAVIRQHPVLARAQRPRRADLRGLLTLRRNNKMHLPHTTEDTGAFVKNAGQLYFFVHFEHVLVRKTEGRVPVFHPHSRPWASSRATPLCPPAGNRPLARAGFPVLYSPQLPRFPANTSIPETSRGTPAETSV